MTPKKNGRISLARLAEGERAIVATLDGGRRILCRLVSLGFTPGAELVMIQNIGGGSLIVQVRDARIALGRGEASRILVVPLLLTD